MPPESATRYLVTGAAGCIGAWTMKLLLRRASTRSADLSPDRRRLRLVGLIWASPREVLNIFQADDIGCDIITVTSDLLKKLGATGKDLGECSLETVQMFYDDARQSGYRL